MRGDFKRYLLGHLNEMTLVALDRLTMVIPGDPMVAMPPLG
jgi:hypothetical protein